MRTFKIIIGFLCVTVLAVSINLTAFAAENNEVSSITTTNETTKFDMFIENTNITPFSSWFGSAGSSSLDYMPGGQAFAWSIDVSKTSILPLTFAGMIDVYNTSTNKHMFTIFIDGSGFGKTSGVGYMTLMHRASLRSGTHYTAKYSGTAINIAGQIFHVVDGASIGFVY